MIETGSKSKLMQSSLRKRLRKSFLDDDEMLEEAPRKRPCQTFEPLERIDPVRRKLDFNQALNDTPMASAKTDPFLRMIESSSSVPKFTRSDRSDTACQLEGLL